MTRLHLITCFLLSISLSGATFGFQDESQPVKAIEQALPYLAKEGASWIAERGCVSCHRVSLSIWAHNEALVRGLEVDKAGLEATTNWALTSMLSDRVEFGGADTISQMLLGRELDSTWRKKPPRHFKSSDPYETLVEILLERQRDDGSWPPEGQLTTPPEITTGWALLALDSFIDPKKNPSEKLDPAKDLTDELADQVKKRKLKYPESRTKGWNYLKSVDQHPSHEGLLLQLMRNGAGSAKLTELRDKVIAKQHADGGWSNLSDDSESDAFATGQTLYALSVSRISVDQSVIRRAKQFLIDSQQPAGHWLVPADRIRGGPRNESLDEIFSYWGTAWATIGLLHTLPETSGGDRQ